MIGLLQRSSEGRAGRLLGELVPFTLGWVGGWMAGALTGWLAGLAVGLLVWCLLSAGISRLRRRPLLRWIYRTALVLHVAFWSIQGVRASRLETPRHPTDGSVARWESVTTFNVGAATRAFALPPRTTLAGWGTRPRRRRLPAFGGFGVLGRASLRLGGAAHPGSPPRAPLFHRPEGSEATDALGARALVLVPDAGGPPLVLVRLDLVVMDAWVTEQVLVRTADRGVVREMLVVAATHTHSAPGGVSAAPLAQVLGTDHLDVTVRKAVVDATVGAIHQALRDARPARLAAARSLDAVADGTPGLARTRGVEADRSPSEEKARVDTRVLALRFEDRDTGQVLALVVNYAVQPVVLRPRYRQFGRDLAGAIEDAISERIEGRPPVLFFNGHCGNVTPNRKGLGSGPAAAAELARHFAERVTPDLISGPATSEVHIRGALAWQDLGSPHAIAAWGSRRSFGEHVLPSIWGKDLPAHFAGILTLPANVGLWSLGLIEVRVGLSFDGSVGAVVNLEEAVPRHVVSAGAISLAPSAPAGATVLLWHPGVGTQSLGRRYRARVEALGLPTPFLLGFANGAMGYLTTETEYDAGSYEASSTLFGRDGSGRVEGLLMQAVQAATASAGR